jgi:cell division protein ZipA
MNMGALPLGLTPLQASLIIFGVVIFLLVIIFSRRDKSGVKTDPRGSRVIAQPRVEEPSTYGIGGDFDEFGVSRPRKRGDAPPARMPQLNIEPGPVRAAPPPERKLPSYMNQPAPAMDGASAARGRTPEPPPAMDGASAARGRTPEPPPVQRRVAPTVTPPPPAMDGGSAARGRTPEPPPAPQRKTEEKIVTLIIARSNGVAMPGPRIHHALEVSGLQFGPMQIYHRKHDGKRVFSTASLLKPGFLIPDEADGFSTMALSMFMVLPGPMQGGAALDDMLATARKLAGYLEAEVYDDRRQVLSRETEQRLRGEVQAWAGVA